MKTSKRQWMVAGALGMMLLAGCASEAYVGSDEGHYHHRHWHHDYYGRPPAYSRGSGVDVYVAPEPVRPNRW